MKLAESRNDRQGQASLLLALGDVNRLHQHHELSRSFYNEALGLYRRLRDPAGVAHTYDQLGQLDGDTGQLGRALQYYRDSRDSSGLVETYEALGRSFEEKGDMEKALSYYLRALTQYEHRGLRPEAYFVLLENIAKLYQRKGDSTKALQYLAEGLHKGYQKDEGASQIRLLTEEGELEEQQHDPLKALVLFKQALAEARKHQQPDQQAEALIQIAGILKQQDAGTSIRDLRQALEIAQRLREPKLSARIYEALAGVYRQQKNYGEAMSALEEQHRLLDSVLNADTVKDIAALDSSYLLETSREKTGRLQEMNRRETAELWLAIVAAAAVLLISLLLWRYLRQSRKFNGELSQLNSDLTNSNQIKDKLFSIIGHDLRNPIGGITQLLAVMEEGGLSEDEARELVTEMRKQGNVTLEILNALLNWGEAQLKGIHIKAADFPVGDSVRKNILALQQQAADKSVIVTDDTSPGIVLHGDPNHFEFIIRNLLSNAIKFSNTGEDVVIAAELRPESNEAVFSVQDHGKGISQVQQDQFRNADMDIAYGTKGEKGTGIGLMLCKEFIKANGGQIWLESELGKGSTFYFSFPMSTKSM
jgi:signal transduction histidine kinase